MAGEGMEKVTAAAPAGESPNGAAAAARQPGDPDGPGSLRGSEGEPKGTKSFNADERAEAREKAEHTIGGEVYFRRRKTWEVTRDMRGQLRLQQKLARKQDRLGARADAITVKLTGVHVRDENGNETEAWETPPILDETEAERLEGEVEELEGKIDEIGAEADEVAYQLIALLLRSEGGAKPTLDHLKEHLDAQDAGDLVTTLAGGGEPDPTPAETSS